MTEKHQLLTDNQFEQKFKNGTLPPILIIHGVELISPKGGKLLLLIKIIELVDLTVKI